MPIKTSTLRPGFLVSLRTTVRGGVDYHRTPLNDEADASNVTVWKTRRVIEDPEENERAKKARIKAGGLVRKVCKQSAFGLLCPESDAEKLETAISAARKVVDEFNDGAKISRIGIYVLTGRVMPDDVEAVRAINSEIRELMAAMKNGIEGSDVEAIREAASKVKGMGEMLAVEAQAKVEVAVKVARETAKQIVKDKEGGGAIAVDKSAARKIGELRAAFLDIDDDETEVAAPKAAAQPRLDIEDGPDFCSDCGARIEANDTHACQGRS